MSSVTLGGVELAVRIKCDNSVWSDDKAALFVDSPPGYLFELSIGKAFV